MKLRKTLTAFGLMAITATGVLTGPASSFAVSDEPTAAVDSAETRSFSGKFVGAAGTSSSNPFFYVRAPGTVGRSTLEAALGDAEQWSFPSLGTSGPVQSGESCLTARGSTFNVGLRCDGSEAQAWRFAPVSGGTGLESVKYPSLFVSYSSYLYHGLHYSVQAMLGPAQASVILPDGKVPGDGGPVDPIADPSISSPVNNSTINDAQPTITGSGEVGAKLKLTDDATGATVGEATIGSDGGWRIQYAQPIAEGTYNLTATQTHEGSTLQASVRFTYKKDAVVEPLTLTTPALDSTIKDSTPTFSGTGAKGADIVIEWPGDAGRTMVADDGTWSWTPTKPVAAGRHAGLVRQFVGSAETSVNYSFTLEAEVAPVEDVKLLSPGAGEKIKPGKPVFSGTGEPGAVVKVVTMMNDTVGQVTVGLDGTWSITWSKSLAPNRYTGGHVIQSVQNVEQSRAPYDFTVEQGDVKPLEVTTPKKGDNIAPGKPVFSGTGAPGAVVKIRTLFGDDVGSQVVNPAGNWSITWSKSLAPNRYQGGTVKQFVGGVERGSFTYDFNVVSNSKPFAVTSPAAGGQVPAGKPVFTGTGTPGATIKIITMMQDNVGETTVKADGSWSITWKKSLAPNRYTGGYTHQTIDGKPVGAPVMYDFTVVQ